MLHFIWVNEYIFIFILLQFILHLNSNTKFNLKWNRNNPKETGKKGAFTNRDQRPLFFPVSFPVSFGLFLFHFRLIFVLEFKWSMNCSNINIYSFTHIKCNTKVNYIQSATKVLLNFVIFTPIIYVWHAITVEFSCRVEDLANNKSAQGFLNRQDPFLWYECIMHLINLW